MDIQCVAWLVFLVPELGVCQLVDYCHRCDAKAVNSDVALCPADRVFNPLLHPLGRLSLTPPSGLPLVESLSCKPSNGIGLQANKDSKVSVAR